MLEINKLKKYSPDRWYLTEKSRGKKVLEIGCINHSVAGIAEQRKYGTWLFDYLHKHAAHATGIDINAEAVNYLAGKGYDVREGDAQNFNLQEQYDVIIVSKVIDHLLNLDGFLKSCKKHLAPGGTLLIADDNILCMPQLFIWGLKKRLGKPDKDITIKSIPEYFKLFTPRYGLKVEQVKYTVGTGDSALMKLFRFTDRVVPGALIYDPLFYPYFIMEIVHEQTNKV